MIIACVAIIFFVLFLTRMMVTPKTKEEVFYPSLSATSPTKRSPSFVVELGKDTTPWYMKPLETKTKQ